MATPGGRQHQHRAALTHSDVLMSFFMAAHTASASTPSCFVDSLATTLVQAWGQGARAHHAGAWVGMQGAGHWGGVWRPQGSAYATGTALTWQQRSYMQPRSTAAHAHLVQLEPPLLGQHFN